MEISYLLAPYKFLSQDQAAFAELTAELLDIAWMMLREKESSHPKTLKLLVFGQT